MNPSIRPRARMRARGCAGSRVRARGCARYRMRVFDRACSRMRARDRARSHVRAGARSRSRVRARDRARSRASARAGARTPAGVRGLFVASWARAWADLGLRAPPAALRDALLRRWAEPWRRYHTRQHLAECLALFGHVRRLARRPGEVELALWFHDAVYEVHSPPPGGNERASADWARDALREAGADDATAARVHALVMATRHDGVPGTPDASLLVDIDLAILGAAPARFAQYERQIRAEYGHVPPALFAAKRGEVLRAFAARPAIYATPALRDRLEAAARASLARALAALPG